MFDILELLGIARYDTSGQLRNPEEVINEWLEKRDLLTWRVWHSLQWYNSTCNASRYHIKFNFKK